MDSSFQDTASLIAVKSDIHDATNPRRPTKDQYFLLFFILGTYFAPDLKEQPLKSILQRRAERLPPYTSEQLARSHMKTAEIERIYYYILRKADWSVVLDLPWLHQFLHGNLPTAMDNPATSYPQFDDLFPQRLHPHSRFKDQDDVIQNIVFINDPEIYYIKPADVKKFKRLTMLKHLHLDGMSARMHMFVGGEILDNVAVHAESVSVDHQKAVQPVSGVLYTGSPPDFELSCKEILPFSTVKYNATSQTCNSSPPSQTNNNPTENCEQHMLFFPSRPSKEEWSNIVAATKSGVALTGSAATGCTGPVLGLVDIGECDDSYLFRVSLPGVKRDEKEFSCEVENDGKVFIRGVTACGEKTVKRYSQVFEMQSQNLCPPGEFSLSFVLPGPVDPRQFSGNFGTDGILEGLVMKPGFKGY